jgi:cell division protein FtsI (penicillin-binding protein 3)
VRALFVGTLFVFSLFAAQLVRLQGIEAEALAKPGQDLRRRADVIPARRGQILDRDGVSLAAEVQRYDIVVNQEALREYTKTAPATKRREKVGTAGAAQDLARVLKTTVADLAPKLTGDSKYVIVAKRVEPLTWRDVKALGIPGVTAEARPQRSYPGGASAAALVGWIGSTGVARQGDGGGLELMYNQALEGQHGESLREYSLDDRVIPTGYNQTVPAVPGGDVLLHLDQDLQWYAYNTVAQQVQELEAAAGYVVVMDVQGRLRATAQYPTFDPEQRGKPGAVLRNMAFQDVFEPGSTAKVMSVGAALAEGVVSPTTMFAVPDKISRADKVFHDSHSHPEERLTVAGILAQSSNVGSIEVGEKVSPEKLEAYYRGFGAGQLSATRFPGEAAGLFAPASQWSGSQRYTVLFGHGMAMSAVQAAGVFQTVANGGVRVPASVVAGVTQPDGSFVANPAPTPVRVVPETVAGQLRRMMESVVGEGGTAKQAMIPGYRVAGKTGTAELYGGRGYTSSFIGFAPAEKPQFIVAVVLQNPKKGHYGGATAGPVFRKVMSYALSAAGIPPSTEAFTPYPLGDPDKAARRAKAGTANARTTPTR